MNSRGFGSFKGMKGESWNSISMCKGISSLIFLKGEKTIEMAFLLCMDVERPGLVSQRLPPSASGHLFKRKRAKTIQNL